MSPHLRIARSAASHAVLRHKRFLLSVFRCPRRFGDDRERLPARRHQRNEEKREDPSSVLLGIRWVVLRSMSLTCVNSIVLKHLGRKSCFEQTVTAQCWQAVHCDVTARLCWVARTSQTYCVQALSNAHYKQTRSAEVVLIEIVRQKKQSCTEKLWNSRTCSCLLNTYFLFLILWTFIRKYQTVYVSRCRAINKLCSNVKGMNVIRTQRIW